jgi:hypothetical protein
MHCQQSFGNNDLPWLEENRGYVNIMIFHDGKEHGDEKLIISIYYEGQLYSSLWDAMSITLRVSPHSILLLQWAN